MMKPFWTVTKGGTILYQGWHRRDVLETIHEALDYARPQEAIKIECVLEENPLVEQEAEKCKK